MLSERRQHHEARGTRNTKRDRQFFFSAESFVRKKDSDRSVGGEVGEHDGFADGVTLVANDVLSERPTTQLIGAANARRS